MIIFIEEIIKIYLLFYKKIHYKCIYMHIINKLTYRTKRTSPHQLPKSLNHEGLDRFER